MPMFIADATVGRLVTWLRLLGCDTVSASGLDPGALARRACAEGRMLLTRNTQLLRQPRGARVVLLRDDDFRRQLRQLVDAGELTAAPAFLHRCARCNALLDAMGRAAACDRVPPYVCATQTVFAHCPSCERIYWAGTHVAHMQREVSRLGLPAA